MGSNALLMAIAKIPGRHSRVSIVVHGKTISACFQGCSAHSFTMIVELAMRQPIGSNPDGDEMISASPIDQIYFG